jgi:hypothetical protein
VPLREFCQFGLNFCHRPCGLIPAYLQTSSSIFALINFD